MIKRTSFRSALFVAIGASTLLLPCERMHAEPVAAKPNLLFVMADDCTYSDIGCYGGQAHTPNIDKLATQGMRFTQCFQAAPMCSPTRHNLYTGLYPVKSGAYPNHTFAKDGTKSVVHYLKPLGYRVALSGKRHVAPTSVFPFEYIGKGKNPDFEKVESFVDECQENKEPFCLFLCSNEPHSPWDKGDASRYAANKLTLPANFVDTPQTRKDMTHYLAEITYYDGQVGDALDLLKKRGLSENTLVIVVSEQGSGFPFAKWTCYDNGLQSAFIARWPGKIAAGSISDALIEYSDVVPTFIEAAGGKPPATLDGTSLLPVLSGTKKEHKQYVFGEMTTRGIINGSAHFGIRSIRSRKYKYIWNFTPEVPFRNIAMSTPMFTSWISKAEGGDADAADKVRRYQRRAGEELYDVNADPLEWNNLADDSKYAAIQKELRTELLNWMEKTGDLGQQTELNALQRQGRGKRKKPLEKATPMKKSTL